MNLQNSTDDTEDDDLLFAADDPTEDIAIVTTNDHTPWKILIVDDEQQVHVITKLVLQNVDYKGQPLCLLSAFSAEEAKGILLSNRDIAVVFLDVVMETDDAGLRLVHWIREELNDNLVRIVLRTGQPGLAPVHTIILKYDINDYKSKTELTQESLFVAVIAALRAYESLKTIELNRQGLDMIIDATTAIFEIHSARVFGIKILTQLTDLLQTNGCAFLCVKDQASHEPIVLIGLRKYAVLMNTPVAKCGDQTVIDAIDTTITLRQNAYSSNYMTLYVPTMNQRDVVLYFETNQINNVETQALVQVFCDKLSVGFDNINLYERLESSQSATVFALADLCEFKDADTGEHVLRMAKMTETVAQQLQKKGPYCNKIDARTLQLIGKASMLHDVGKISVPDNILRKAGKLTEVEWAIMQKHTEVGEQLLTKAANLVEGESYLSLGALIAGSHHEYFDGNGYPRGLAGDEIPLPARIVALIDVFDALCSKRPYKKPWPVEQAIVEIKNKSGTQFEPAIVDAFLELIEQGVIPC